MAQAIELTHRMRDIELLYQMEREASAAQDLNELLEGLSRRAVQLLSGEAGMIGLVRKDGDLDLTFFHQPPIPFEQTALPPVEIKHTVLPQGHGLLPWVVNHNLPLRINDTTKDPRVSGRGAKLLGLPMRQTVMAPLHYIEISEEEESQEQVLGVIAVINKVGARTGTGFDQVDSELLTLIAGHAARAIVLSKAKMAKIQQNHLSSIGGMLAGLMHDLRTPLTVISGYSQLLSTSEDAKERTFYNEQIRRQCGLVESMIHDVLSFAKGESHLLVRRVFLDRFLEEAKAYLPKQIAPVTLEVDARFMGTAWFDEHKLMRVIQNLAKNAAQAMPQGGYFRIETDIIKREGNQEDILFVFSDNGPGIPEEIHRRMFEPFASQKQGGTGLGLPIVKKIIEDHGGTIQVETKPKEGTTFSITIPRTASSQKSV